MIGVKPGLCAFGDLHGQLSDLLRLLKRTGQPPDVRLLFLGDLVDRSGKGMECAMLLIAWKLLYPTRIHVLRGNHELGRQSRRYGFYGECKKRRSVRVWKAYQRVFFELPLVALIGQRILAMHGGLSPHIVNWDSLEKLEKPRTEIASDTGVCRDLMWADPDHSEDPDFFFIPNTARRCSVVFGLGAVNRVMDELGVTLILRAHEVVQGGHEFTNNHKVCTIFSAPCYARLHNNTAAVIKICKNFTYAFVCLAPKEEKTLSEEEE